MAVYPLSGQTIDDLLKNADISMYQAKNLGKNRFVIFTDELNTKVKRIHEIESGLSKAIITNQLYLEYQPIFNVKTKNFRSVEALLRWRNPLLHNPPPSEFIPVAELSKLINVIGEWVLETAVREMAGLKKQGQFVNLNLSINISAKQLKDPGLIDFIINTINNYDYPAKELIIEVTETAVMTNINSSATSLKKLSDVGVKIALDDFGTGYSSMLYLKKLPIDFIKIDREFISGIVEDINDRSIVKAVIQLAKGLELDVIAEGVETKEQLDFLLENNCDSFQGFLYAKPMDIETLIKRYGKLEK